MIIWYIILSVIRHALSIIFRLPSFQNFNFSMPKIKNFVRRAGVAVATCSPALLFAEGTGSDVSGNVVDTSVLTDYITQGVTSTKTILGAGAAIVGCLFVWALMKKALNRSK